MLKGNQIRCFAKHHSNKKIIILCNENEIEDITKNLDTTYGGEWLYVDDINFRKEYLFYEDEIEYLGYNQKKERYTDRRDANILKKS